MFNINETKIILAILISLIFSPFCKAADSGETNAPEALLKLGQIAGLSGSPKEVYDLTKELLESIRDKSRDNQEIIFDTVKQMEDSLTILEKDSRFSYFTNEVQSTFSELKKMATEKDLNSNDNLNRIVNKRIPRLLVNMLTIVSNASNNEVSKSRNSRFIEDLSLISDVYAKTKRFSVGLGLSYSYMPRFKYDNLGVVDLTAYQTLNDIRNINLRDTSISYSPSIEQKGFFSVTISAEIKYIALQLSLPVYDESLESTSIVRFAELDDNSYAAYRNYIQSKIKIDYDIAIKGSVRDVVQRWRPWHFRQFDYGVGYGVTGIKIEDTITTELRFTSDLTTNFNDITSSETIAKKQSSDFLTQYFLLYSKLEVSDDFEAGLDIKFYQSKSIGSSYLDIKDTAISLNLLYYY
ncbi:hypothetical protein [uncultured Paraglaciecola sp.]|uniref:hypothetical protein n=1 Tax=uncultured Paraglaciecola sp. TaxID=1765024 RepID=UPI002599FA9B|nr:hypothetical protein [uncultured Paraglaciecola sp.]